MSNIKSNIREVETEYFALLIYNCLHRQYMQYWPGLFKNKMIKRKSDEFKNRKSIEMLLIFVLPLISRFINKGQNY